ncbi:hypothetical protein [Lacticaseibacillus jixiensis]|uniref:hypothetical protein n=1 Tax=Lacticaseibacillus jixiensis TaxID=3231926 RepID=UPI0036F215F9
MEWEEFTYSALKQLKPRLSFVEYQLIINDNRTDQRISIRQDQYALLGALRLKIRVLEILEWRLGLNHHASAELTGVICPTLAAQFGTLLEPIRQADKPTSGSEITGLRMLGFLYARLSEQHAEHVITELCKNMQLPARISFESALKINHQSIVAVERSESYVDRKPSFQIKHNGIAIVSGPSREAVESTYLLRKFGKDLRELKHVPRYRRHHAPLSWAVWLLPNQFSKYWQLNDQDAIDLMDDSPQHKKDRLILQRIGKLQLHSALVIHRIRHTSVDFKFDDLCCALYESLIMPDYIQDSDQREDFLFEFVGFWQIKRHAVLPAIWVELKRHTTSTISSKPHESLVATPVNGAIISNTVQTKCSAKTQEYIDSVAKHHRQVSIGEYPPITNVSVDQTFPALLKSLHQLDEIKSIAWFSKSTLPVDVMAIGTFLLRSRIEHQVSVNVVGSYLPTKVRPHKKHLKPHQKMYAALIQAGAIIKHTASYANMQSFLQINYQYQTIIIQSATKDELAFTRHGQQHSWPSVTITCCTYAHPLAQTLHAQQLELTRQEQARLTDEQHQTTSAKTKAQRLAKPHTLNTRDYFKERLAAVTDVEIKNRLKEWMKYQPDIIQQNISIVHQPYFALFFKSRHVVILDSFEPKNAYFVFYDKTLKEVVSHVRHLKSKQAVLQYSSMVKRGYHDTEPISWRVRRIFLRQL